MNNSVDPDQNDNERGAQLDHFKDFEEMSGMNKNDSYRQKQSHEYAMNEVVNTQNDMISHFDDRFLDL